MNISVRSHRLTRRASLKRRLAVAAVAAVVVWVLGGYLFWLSLLVPSLVLVLAPPIWLLSKSAEKHTHRALMAGVALFLAMQGSHQLGRELFFLRLETALPAFDRAANELASQGTSSAPGAGGLFIAHGHDGAVVRYRHPRGRTAIFYFPGGPPTPDWRHIVGRWYGITGD